MTYIKILIAVTLLVTAPNTFTRAQSTASASDVQKTDEYSKLGDAWNDKCLSGNCSNGKGERGYRNGDSYEGDFVKGRKVGQGTYTFKNGDYYVGEWKNDKWNGAGKYFVASKNAFLDGIWANGLLVKSTTPTDKCVSGNCVNGKGKMVYVIGDVYEGDFVKGKKSGKGILTYKNGDIYVGEFISDRKEGQGTLTFKDGAVYVGQFGIDLFYLNGKMKYANGDIYDGNWAIGLREGQGTYKFKNGDYYIGEWLNDKWNGQGKYYAKATNRFQEGMWKDNVFVKAPVTETGQMTFEGGAKYDGPVEQAPAIGSTTTKCISGNCLNGFGKYIFPTGVIYEGTFVNGSANGKGKVTRTDGSTYVGDLVNGKMDGKGILLSANGNTYDGGWMGNLKSGQGTQTLKQSGELYVGQFANDKRNGKGKATYKNGDIYDGDWVNGLREGQATYTFPNGSYYIGGFKNDKQDGPGKQFNKLTGRITEGTWKEGAFVNTPGVTKITATDAGPKTPVVETATLLRETLNGKFDYMDRKPLTYILTNKKTGEVLRYQIEFIEDGGKLAFRWKESTKKEQSEKLVITDEALRSATKFVNFYASKTAIAPDKEIAFILSQKLHKEMKYNNEIRLDLGSGVKRYTYLMSLSAPSGTYTDKRIMVLHFQANEGSGKIQILDDPICPLIIKIETEEFTLALV
ncbi:MAG: hypothetical protein IPI64_10740 [Chloracidobacterium sp.]|nr:hypothetical protein [Chloracidobacterium sp.]